MAPGSVRRTLQSIRILQLVFFTSTLTSSVCPKQYLLPLSVFYVQDYWEGSQGLSLAVAGLLTGCYYLGKAVGGGMWRQSGLRWDLRKPGTVGLMVEVTLTFALSLIMNVSLACFLRLLAGLFSPTSALISLGMDRLTKECGELLVPSIITTAIVAALSQATGVFIACGLAFPLYSQPDPRQSLFEAAPYLLPTLTVATLHFFSILIFFLDFPDRENDQMQTGKKGGKKEEKHVKYAELAESTSQIESLPKVEEPTPVTIRRDDAEEADDDLPAYLQCYELEHYDIHNGAPIAMSQRVNRREITPPMSKRAVPMSARPQFNERVTTTDGVRTTLEETEKWVISTIPKGKTTHISYIEDNFVPRVANDAITLEDIYKRTDIEGNWPLSLAVVSVCVSSLVASWSEGAVVMWMSMEEMSVLQIAGVLSGAMLGVLVLMGTFPVMCAVVPLYPTAVLHFCGLAVTLSVPLLLVRLQLQGLNRMLSLLFYLLVVKYLSTFSSSYSVLQVSDSVPLPARSSVLFRAESFAVFFKAIGYCGSGVAYYFLPIYAFILPVCFTLANTVIIMLSRSHFPRFRVSPYRH